MVNLILFESGKEPLKIGTKSLSVFILENNQRVILIKSIQKALGYEGKNEKWLFEFLNDINIYMPINTAILNAYQNPIKITHSQKDDLTLNTVDADFLIETMDLIVKAKNGGFLNVNQIKFAKEAKLLIEDENSLNLKKLIDFNTGFTLYKENSMDKMIFNLQKNDLAFVWIKTFPDYFFELLMEMKNINWKNLPQNHKIYGEILSEIIFSRLDNSLLEALRILKPKRTYQRKNSKPQDLEHPTLKQHLAILFSLAKLSGNNWTIFIQLLNKSFPEQKNKQFKKIKITEGNQSSSLSNFDKNLLKSFIFKTK